LFWSIAAFVEALAERQPVALMIDDLHWADSSSLELIQYLARRTRDDRVLLLSTYRDVEVRRAHPLESALRELNRQDLLQRVPVRRLDPDGTRDLVGVILNDDRVSDELAGFLFERTEGNPLFIQQVLRVLVDRGDVYHADGRWDGKDLLGVDVPESIRSVIGQRLSRLDDETQEALRWASIFGQSFEFDDLAALLESDEDVVERMMQGASAVGLVDSLDGETYRFDHSLTQQTLYAEIPGRRRRRMHVAAAVAVERSGGQRPRAATISRHYLEGEDQANALKFVLMAGDQAAAVAAPSDAQAHYRVAVELARESGDKNRLALSLEKLGGIYLQTIQYPKALACLDEASDVYREVGEPEGRARSKVRSATALALGQRAEEAVTLIDRLVPGLQAAGFTSIIASAYAVQARAFLSLSRFEEELAVAEKAEKLARETGDRTTLASALVDHATALGELGDARAAMPIMEEAIALAEAEADDIILFRALNNAGLTVLPALGMAATREYHERALAVAERSASPCDIAFARVVMGGYAWLAGEWTEALNRFESAAGIARQLGVSQAGWTMALPAWIRVLRGREDQATRELEECIAWAEDHSDRHLLLHANQRLAQQDILCGRPRKALARVEQVRGTPVTQADMRYGLALVGAEAALDLRDHMKARVFLDELAAVNRKEPWFKVDRLRLEAYWFSRTGEVVAADAGFDEALRMAREIPYPQGEADCLRAWALADDARGDGTAARAHLESAHKIYRDLGAHPMAEATARELLVHRSD
ncbi:MAG TPA: hypothetical protein VG815_00810, partial [Chloroflexota bacterium]|nr:hypothetical protein [Chloroflexota bacterium]